MCVECDEYAAEEGVSDHLTEAMDSGSRAWKAASCDAASKDSFSLVMRTLLPEIETPKCFRV